MATDKKDDSKAPADPADALAQTQLAANEQVATDIPAKPADPSSEQGYHDEDGATLAKMANDGLPPTHQTFPPVRPASLAGVPEGVNAFNVQGDQPAIAAARKERYEQSEADRKAAEAENAKNLKTQAKASK